MRANAFAALVPAASGACGCTGVFVPPHRAAAAGTLVEYHIAATTAGRFFRKDQRSMKVLVGCPNGHRFKCDEAHLGKSAKCPHPGCGRQFVLRRLDQQQQQRRANSHADDSPASPASSHHQSSKRKLQQCPMCLVTLAPDAVLCINCGYNIKANTQLNTVIAQTDDDQQQHRRKRWWLW